MEDKHIELLDPLVSKTDFTELFSESTLTTPTLDLEVVATTGCCEPPRPN
jgi:hypothetical protein